MPDTLTLHHHLLLSAIPESVQTFPDQTEVGIFLRFTAEKPEARHVFTIGTAEGLHRFTCCHRYEPFWMKPKAGTQAGQVAVETQWLLTKQQDGSCALYIPLLDGPFRASLQGAGEHGLELVVESGDPATVGAEFVGLFVAVGDDPYTLMEQAAESVTAHLGTGRLRRRKALPEFVDAFGWCTWDAFYQDVTLDKVRSGLASFAEGDVIPRTLILDDGWQSVAPMASGEQRLTAFEANDKFPGDLGPTVTMAKTEFGVETFLVWHAMTGYWGGVDGDALPAYDVRSTLRQFSPGIAHHVPDFNGGWWGKIAGIVSPQGIYRFFQDYHRHLRMQGVDGVKVDTQATLEGVGAGFGGRVELMRHYREALEGAVQTQFAGNLINCMSCSSEMLYGALNSNLTRTSTDFWPDLPESHGLHLYCNAQVSAWFGEFIYPDWDMFQSGHPMGAFHAAGRAVGGCPVYVSDKPGKHDFALLRKLVLPDGGILRCPEPGRPTHDCLFHDPTQEDVLLKIFNHNREAGVVGVFNARYMQAEPETPVLTGTVGPADVAGLAGERFAVLAQSTGQVDVLARDETRTVTLPPLGFEVFTLVPVEDGIAPLGFVEMFNSAGAVTDKGWFSSTAYELTLCGTGRLWVWSEHTPVRVVAADGRDIPFHYDAATCLISVEGQAGRLRFFF